MKIDWYAAWWATAPFLLVGGLALIQWVFGPAAMAIVLCVIGGCALWAGGYYILKR